MNAKKSKSSKSSRSARPAPKRGRPPKRACDASSLEMLAELLRTYAGDLKKAAKVLQQDGEGRSVKVDFFKDIHRGLMAIKRLPLEVQIKITGREFVDQQGHQDWEEG